jgi:hypothetical protein
MIGLKLFDQLDRERLMKTIKNVSDFHMFYGHYREQGPWNFENVRLVQVQCGVYHGQRDCYQRESYRLVVEWNNGDAFAVLLDFEHGLDREDWQEQKAVYGSGFSGVSPTDEVDQYGAFFVPTSQKRTLYARSF